VQPKYDIKEYLTPDGHNPFRAWLDELDRAIGARIQARVYRFELGNLGDAKGVGNGVFEARFDFGPGYRLYFGRDGRTIIVLLCGGDKAAQSKDIRRAKQLWADYLERKDAST
jgi:putative addiction module killer protein